MLLTKPPASYRLDIAAVKRSNDIGHRRKWGGNRTMLGNQLTKQVATFRSESQPVVTVATKEGFGVLPKARVHHDIFSIERDPLRFGVGMASSRCLDRCRFVQDALGGPGASPLIARARRGMLRRQFTLLTADFRRPTSAPWPSTVRLLSLAGPPTLGFARRVGGQVTRQVSFDRPVAPPSSRMWWV